MTQISVRDFFELVAQGDISVSFDWLKSYFTTTGDDLSDGALSEIKRLGLDCSLSERDAERMRSLRGPETK